jgi:tRNA pseudouridine38-40 synthase
MVDVGAGRRRAGDLADIIRSGDRQRVGDLAPPHGLCLWRVGYDDGFGG